MKLPDKFVLSAYVDGLSDYFIVPQADWADLLPRVNRLAVHPGKLSLPLRSNLLLMTSFQVPSNAPARLTNTGGPESTDQPGSPATRIQARSSSILVISDSDDDEESGSQQGSHLPDLQVKAEERIAHNTRSEVRKRRREADSEDDSGEEAAAARFSGSSNRW